MSEDKTPPVYNLLNGRPTYKPFQYPWAYEAYRIQQSIHWLPNEIPLGDDVKDWNTKLTDLQKYTATQIFRLFTQQDTEVENAYIDLYGPRFKPPEVRMMLSVFAAMEANHQDAYSHLLDTIGIPEVEYSAFLEYKEMADKHNFLKSFHMNDHFNTALSMAVFAGFTEGLQLFASFAILMSYPHKGLMKGMGQVVTWSVRDECLVEGTEILTTRGWVEFKDLTDTDQVAQYDMRSKKISFVKPLKRVEYDVDKNLIHFHRADRRIDTCVTPDHGIVAANLDRVGSPTIRLQAELFEPDSHMAFPISGFRTNGNKNQFTALDQFRVAFCADGTMPINLDIGNDRGHHRVVVGIKKERKKERLRQILKSAKLEYSESPAAQDGTVQFRVNAPADITKYLDHFVDLNSVSNKWADAFFDELMHWDGHDRYSDSSTNVYGTTNESDVNIVQALAAISGRIANASKSADPRGYKDYWRVHITKQEFLRTGTCNKTSVPYKGKVYCVNVPTGAIVTRYNHTVVITGNTLHIESISKLFKTYLEEFGDQIDKQALDKAIYDACEEVVVNEERFINLAFKMGQINDLTPDDIKKYIRFIANRRLRGLGLEDLYSGVDENPIPWMDEMMNAVEHTNFFENRATEYSRAATGGTWDDAFNVHVELGAVNDDPSAD